MISRFGITAFCLTFFLFFAKQCIAESSYVLPYPPQMPGGFMYKLRLMSEEIQKYWYFGNFGKFKYNLKEADKYLVEAKTLFDYKQYALAYKALQKSDIYFSKTFAYLVKAKKEGKNITQNQLILKGAASKHIEVLGKLEIILPETFIWQQEQSAPIQLDLKKYFLRSIEVRKKFL